VKVASSTGRSRIALQGSERDSLPQFDRVDLLGAALAGGLIVWTSVAAVANSGNPLPITLLVLGSALAYTASRWAAGRRPVAVPALLVAMGLVLILIDPGGIFDDHPASGPFGYANAKAAVYVLAAIGAAMLAISRIPARVRIGAWAAAMIFAIVPVISRARAATVVVGLVAMAVMFSLRGGSRRPYFWMCAVVILVAALGTTALGGWGEPTSLDDALDHRRVRLWSEAADLMVEHPAFGVGPGRFAAESPTGGSDADARWAHHAFLHQAAETGLPGYGLLLLLFLWAVLRIATAPGPPGVAVVAAAGVAATATMASFDYILHFPLITVAAAAIAGAGAPLGGGGEWNPGTVVRKAAKSVALPWGLLRSRRAGDLVILLWHRVGIGGREIDVASASFEEQMAMLAEAGEVRELEDALRLGTGGVVVTFDDGYRDFHELALPVLVRHRIPAVLYLATGLVDGGPDALSWSQLNEASSTGLVTIGGHTHGHTDLSRANQQVADGEMRRCKDLIEDRLGVACRHFAYPWAVGSPAADRTARRLFDSAALDAWRTNRRGRTDPYRLGRTPVLRSDGDLFFRWKARGMLDGEAWGYRVLRRGPWRVP
jgi:peptidoglycan/xylan/chitin deacetylase (PgdA/CDA1 family)